MFLDTGALIEYISRAEKVDADKAAQIAIQQSGLKNPGTLYRAKFSSGKFILVGTGIEKNLKNYCRCLHETTGEQYREWYIFWKQVPESGEYLPEEAARHLVGIPTPPSKKSTLPEATTMQREILAELKAMRKLQEETCNFIKTLVIALNGAPGGGK